MAAAEQIIIPPCEARRARIAAGERFRIVDLDGCQCVDFWVIRAGDITEWASAEHTRVEVGRLFPIVGEQFYTNRRRPVLTFVEDNSPGIHDMLVAACDAARYRNLGVKDWHPSCEENFFEQASELGWSYPFLPQSISWFTNIPIDAERRIGWEPAPSKQGDNVVLRAEIDCDVIVCACSQDLVPINCRRPTPLGLELLGRDSP